MKFLPPQLDYSLKIKSIDHFTLSIDDYSTVSKNIVKSSHNYGVEYDLDFLNGDEYNNNIIFEKPI
jgi:hypothetical protein